MGTYITAPGADALGAFETEVPGPDGVDGIKEGIAAKETTGKIAETREGINFRFTLTGDMPADLKEASDVQFAIYANGSGGSPLDAQLVLHDGAGGNMGFRNAKFGTAGVDKVLLFDMDSETSGAPSVWTRAKIETAQMRMRTIATGTGDEPDAEE